MMSDPRPKRTGTIFKYAPAKPGELHGHYVVRCSAPDGTRPLFHLDPTPQSDEHEAEARQTAIEISDELWVRGLGASTKRRAPAVDPDSATGMAAWLALWLVERKRRGYTSTPENASHYREHIEPAIGPKHVRDWTADDLRTLTRVLDAKVQAANISWKSAANVWGTATKMCKDASSSKVEALRVRVDNPTIGVLGPDRGARTVKQYLYPSEFLRFVSCERVPLEWRRAVALAISMFPRAGELRVLRWEDVDLVHGTVHIHRARDRNTGEEKPMKTAVARRFSTEATLRPLLAALHNEAGGKGYVAALPSERDMQRGFRRWLMKAGVDRAELHTASRTRKAITFHDLRATGLTWLAVRGDDPLKIMQRAGHVDFATTQGYIREAEAVREGFGEPFPALPESILRASPDPDGGGPKTRVGVPSRVVTDALSQELSRASQVSRNSAGRTGLECSDGCTIRHENGSIGHGRGGGHRRRPCGSVPNRAGGRTLADEWRGRLGRRS